LALGWLLVPVAQGADSYGYDLPKQLLSPWCPGRTLADCPSPNAESVRLWILVQEAAGRSEDEVTADLLDRFGDQILGAPKAEGVGLTAYLAPATAFLIGGGLVFVFLRRQARQARLLASEVLAVDGPDAPLDPELERLVDEDLAR
jgi:cytochrome c-type biogenesis protein CcmH/NrfF